MNDVKIMISPIDNLINMMFYGDPNVDIDMLSCITLAGVAQMSKWSYCFINFVPHNFLNYIDNVIPPNPQQDCELETVDVEDCIDELNDFHFKKPKVNLPTFDKNFTSKNDNIRKVCLQNLLQALLICGLK
jgi:hypothetical protein